MIGRESSGDGGGRLWLVRHASTAWTGRRFCGRTDLSLSDSGRAEAVALAERLAARVPYGVRIASAPARRARETADVLHASLHGGGIVELDDRLREVDFGQAEGLTFDQITDTLPAVANALAAGESIDWPDGESAASLRDRAAEVWLDASRAAPRVLVTHGGFIRALLEVAFGRSPTTEVWIGPTAVIELRRTGGRWQSIGP